MAETTTDDRPTVWQTVTELINNPAGLDLGPGGQRVVFEGGKKCVTLFHDRDNRLRLIAKSGERILGLSLPIAFNPTTASVDDWCWLDSARSAYDTWAMTVKAKKGGCRTVRQVPQAAPKKRAVSPRRLVLESRPSVKKIAARHGIPIEVAVEVYRDR